MTSWNRDISAAPTDIPVWLATKCGKVIKSYWLEKTRFSPARWAVLNHTEAPVAWHPFVVPQHPDHQSDVGEFAAVKGKARLANAVGVEPSTSGHFHLDDAGSGA